MKRTSPGAVRDSAFAARSGFTLLELLVVVAVVLVLAGLLFPVASSMQDSAKDSKCLSNLRSIVTAAHAYANENNGFFPKAFDRNQPGALQFWHAQLLPYLDDGNSEGSEVFLCPHNEVKVTASRYACTYSVHPGLMPQNPPLQWFVGPLPRQAVPRPSQIILVADGTQAVAGGVSDTSLTNPFAVFAPNNTPLTTVLTPLPQWDNDQSARHLRFRHGGRLQAGMLDGSARSFRKEDLTYGQFVLDR